MLEIKFSYDDEPIVLRFEHSLLALSKWEAKHKKPFLSSENKKATEMVDYFQCMLVTPEADANLVYAIPADKLEELTNYINDTQTASSVPKQGDSLPSREIVTSELIYYWMVELGIPFEAETWHLNRLMMLVQITNIKKQPPKKRNAADVAADWRALNEQRRKQLNTKG